ncbi:MAG: hypothetical protein NZM12_03655, partial [Steroidobacteraceae bacterium]|nr:hypothetical protein [Steroidobacteraceae bacterium]
MKRVGCVAALVALAALGGCASVPDEEDPLLIRLNDLDARVARTERIVNNQSLVELADRVAALQTELRTLRGQVEELENAAAQLRKQQLDLYADLDKRIAGDAARAG